MATLIPLKNKCSLLFALVLFFFSTSVNCVTKESSATNVHASDYVYETHTFEVSSLLPSTDESSCKSSPNKARRKVNSLEVSHTLGPCSPLRTSEVNLPTHVEILERDQERVNSIRERVNPRLAEMQVDKQIDKKKNKPVRQKAVVLPAKSGSIIGSGNFFVTVGLGTPAKPYSLIFDTGSDFTWTQCEPCKRSCYQQVQPIFNPAQSSTYSNITCSSPLCSEVVTATSAAPGCSASTCVYGIQYGDSSFSVGYFAKDTLTLGTSLVPNFLFGCGENNQGLFGGSAGLLGLGRNKMSAVSQTASQFGNYFSYCLPSKSSATGHLTFGKGGTTSNAIQYTPMLSSSAGPSFYFLEFQGLVVGGQKLAISPSVFSTGGSLIDSGTVISRLPPAAHTALETAFSKAMTQYPKAPPLSILTTCYDFSKFSTITAPKVGMVFGGGAYLDLPAQGIFYVKSLSQVCLAFAPNSDVSDVTIIGNVQQLTHDVIYDVAGGKLGFGAGGCI